MTSFARTPEELDLAVWPIFARMTERGIRVDVAKLHALRREVADELEAQTAALEVYAGRPLNPHSPQDVAAWLAAEGLSTGRRTRGGAPATDERALSLAITAHPVPGTVLECRGLRKLLSTFVDPILERTERDPVIHPRWRLTKVKSGRPSMEDPNLLAFPSRDAWGRKVRDCFVARPGHLLVSIDFSQIEPRVCAALSQDAALKDAFATGQDVYADYARRLFRLPPGVEPDPRRHRLPAKVIFLGAVMYGMQPLRLFEELNRYGCVGYSMEVCEDFVRRRFEPYPGVAALHQTAIERAVVCGGVAYTLGGRPRPLPALLLTENRWPAKMLRLEAERQCFNHLIQGTAQEVTKKGMLRADAVDDVFPLLQIYDEMIYEVPERLAPAAANELMVLMGARLSGVPIPATKQIAESWGALK